MNNTIDEQQEDLDPIEDMADPKKGLMFFALRLFKGMFHSDKKIGEMNGKWAALFRVVLVLTFLTIPAVGTWGVWVSRSVWSSQYHREATSEFEKRINVLEQSCTLLNKVDEQVDELADEIKLLPQQLPSKEWQESVDVQVEENAAATQEIKDEIIKLDKTNTSEHSKISAELKESLGEMDKKSSVERASIAATLQFIKEQVSKQ